MLRRQDRRNVSTEYQTGVGFDAPAHKFIIKDNDVANGFMLNEYFFVKTFKTIFQTDICTSHYLYPVNKTTPLMKAIEVLTTAGTSKNKQPEKESRQSAKRVLFVFLKEKKTE